MNHKTVDKAKAGGVNVKNLKKENIPQTGDVVCIDDPAVDPNPPKQATKFTAFVFVQDHPEQLKESTNDEKGNYKGGFTP
ncbi:hypothetical protein RFI_01796 [Reticulomyxa filosa]|uniref:Uncharacterized protein n=1 Tax=Reticulomyxa filosa TaxID=46433 RepID=X6PC71_RETFI|nr:hypothetical protein RFI_01796 [Reticulomyxa filosa]|eukprot:ETO35267.1 hypothetical protein RFI_01796 [Reticulomyxa filosa]